MSKNKPKAKAKEKLKPKAKKVNGRKSWLKVAKRVHELNKKNNLGWTWSESLRFASQKIYPKYKGLPQQKITFKEIDSDFNKEIAISKMPITKTPKPIQICDDVRQISDDDLLLENDFYLIAEEETWSIFTANMPMRFAFDGIIDTGIIPKYLMPDMKDMKDIREKMRKIYGNTSPVPQFIFKRLVQPNKKDDGNPCSYYILVTMLESSYDSDDDTEILSDKKLTEEEKIQRQTKRQIEKKTKSKAKARKRPTEVEPKSITKSKSESQKESEKNEIDKEIELEKLKVKKSSNLTEALKLLRKNFDDGLMTKREFREANKKLLDRFEKGGEI